MTTTHNLGFPRIGANRELKFALEAYWRGDIDQAALDERGRQLRADHWRLQRDAGLDLLPVGDFAWYDQMLDHSVMFGAIPARHRYADDPARIDLDLLFRMARGRAPSGGDAPACGMIKWFDTNYHFIVPELGAGQRFELHGDALLAQIDEALALGHPVKPVLIGPLTWLWHARCDGDVDRLALLPALLPCYRELLRQFTARNIGWVQVDEPILALDLPAEWQRAFADAYAALHGNGVKLLLASYFGGVGHQLAWLPGVAVDGWHIDLASDGGQLDAVIAALDPAQTLSAGIIDGRNVWRADLDRCLHLLQPAHRQLGSRLWLAPGCSLLHCPVDLAGETQLPSNVRARLAFAAQKLVELKALARVLDGGDEGTVFAGSRRARQVAEQDRAICNPAVRARVAALGDGDAERDTPAPERARLQQEALQLPPFPTTTIGSFPQTPAIRQLRAEFRADRIGERDYVRGMRDEIAHCIREQEALDLDVLVHGEAERGDMVEYFGEQLAGFVFTANGWVQSYGSRCVKPPIIAGDVSRPLPITVAWTRYAQSLTERPVKGMLTGPVTILKWSFVRGDLPRRDVALQIALALRDEVSDLENAGIRIIQLDEPAFREALPLRREDRDHYLDWAVRAFRVAAGAARATTQIHSHMCYSEFDTVGEAIAALDVDVLTVETSRSESNVLKVFCHCETPHAVGPGAYDIHSPLVPRADEIEQRMRDALQWLPAHRLWVNPDCGLKTRQWPETIAALAAMVDAAKRLRESLGATTAPAPASDCPRSPAPPPPTRGTATAAR